MGARLFGLSEPVFLGDSDAYRGRKGPLECWIYNAGRVASTPQPRTLQEHAVAGGQESQQILQGLAGFCTFSSLSILSLRLQISVPLNR